MRYSARCYTLPPVLYLLLATCLLSAPGLRAETGTNRLAGRHRIEIGFGLLSDIEGMNSSRFVGTATDVSIDGALFNMGYAYWPREEWSLSLKMAVLGVDASQLVTAGRVTSETSTVVPFIFGIGYQPKALALSEGVRPFFTVGVGSFLGVRTQENIDLTVSNRTSTETAFGAHFGAGVDCLLNRLLSLSVRGGYYLVSDFDIPVSGKDNYSTPEFSVGLGFNFGRGK